MTAQQHPLVAFAALKLDDAFAAFKATGGGADEWGELTAAMMRFQQARQVAGRGGQALDEEIDALLLRLSGCADMGSWSKAVAFWCSDDKAARP